LVAQFGGRDTPAAGFAIGLERLVLLLQQGEMAAETVDLYIVLADDAALQHALPHIENLRQALPDCAIQMNLGGGSFKAQFKRADKSGAAWALVYGQTEVAEGQVTLKPLRSDGTQQTVAQEQLVETLAAVWPEQLRV